MTRYIAADSSVISELGVQVRLDQHSRYQHSKYQHSVGKLQRTVHRFHEKRRNIIANPFVGLDATSDRCERFCTAITVLAIIALLILLCGWTLNQLFSGCDWSLPGMLNGILQIRFYMA